MSEPETVELHPAHTWDCPGCGAPNFCRGIRVELTPDERAKMREDMGLGDNEGGDWMTMPAEVSCGKCGRAYATQRDDALPDDFNPHEAFGREY